MVDNPEVDSLSKQGLLLHPGALRLEELQEGTTIPPLDIPLSEFCEI